MGKVLVTVTASGLTEAIATEELKEIVALTGGGSELYFKTTNRGRLQVDESLAVLFAQQNTALFDLGMVLVTDSALARQVILFAHNFESVGIVQEKDNAGVVIGSRIIQKDAMPDYLVDELVAAIYAQQKASVNLGMNLVNRIQSAQSNEPLVIMDQGINYIIDEVENAVTTTYVVFKASNLGKMKVVETATAIHGAQSA